VPKLLTAGGNTYLFVRWDRGEIHVLDMVDGATPRYLGMIAETATGDYGIDVDDQGDLYYFGTHIDPEGDWYRLDAQ
jgi:hypothetical protein